MEKNSWNDVSVNSENNDIIQLNSLWIFDDFFFSLSEKIILYGSNKTAMGRKFEGYKKY